jgi:hypothetical protein
VQEASYISNIQAARMVGSQPTYETVVAVFPAANHLSISPFSSMPADCLDIEAGDATNDEAAAWLHGWRPSNTPLPVPYTSISNAAELIADLAAAGWANSKYLLWMAHYASSNSIWRSAGGKEESGLDRSFLGCVFGTPIIERRPSAAVDGVRQRGVPAKAALETLDVDRRRLFPGALADHLSWPD